MVPKEVKAYSLEITRVIRAPRSRVYAAWTDPEQLRQWFGPENVRTRRLTTDVRPGGEYEWEVTSPNGEELTCRGAYRELEQDRKIVFTWQWDNDEDWQDQESIVTIELLDCDEGTELRLRHERLPNEQSRNGHERGWNSAVDQLEKFLTEQE
jgi:uncharacterized protein YndB with AHSA1/START domain